MPVLTLWYGLPGSGKSTHLKTFQARGYTVFDDFMKCSLFNLKGFVHSRHLGDIIRALRQSKPCAIADVVLCRNDFRSEMAAYLVELVPDLSFEWHCLDCSSPEAIELCRENVHYRSQILTRNEELSLKIIDDMKEHFSIAKEAFVYEVISGRKLTAQFASP